MACGGGILSPLNMGAASAAVSGIPTSGMDFFSWIKGGW